MYIDLPGLLSDCLDSTQSTADHFGLVLRVEARAIATRDGTDRVRREPFHQVFHVTTVLALGAPREAIVQLSVLMIGCCRR